MNFKIILIVLIVLNLFLVLYVNILYRFILSILAKFFKKPVNISDNYKPEITAVIAAYNEELYIEKAIESYFNSDYPKEKLFLIVGSDGSTDATSEVVKKLQKKYSNIILAELPRSGKNNVLNAVMPLIKTELVMFIDADLRLQKDTLPRLVSKMVDEAVGAVAGRIVISASDNDENNDFEGEGVYQAIETHTKIYESLISSIVNCSGAYVIRHSLCKPIVDNNVADDSFNVFSVNLQKKRFLFDEKAYVIEARSKSLNGELQRRIRVTAGGFLAAVWGRKLLNFKYGWVSFFFLSHKMVRYCLPVELAVLFVCSGLILPANITVFNWIFYLQALGYSAAFLGWILEKLNIPKNPLRIVTFLVIANITSFIGIMKALRKRQSSQWENNGAE